jgi:hypothetical protein
MLQPKRTKFRRVHKMKMKGMLKEVINLLTELSESKQQKELGSLQDKLKLRVSLLQDI